MSPAGALRCVAGDFCSFLSESSGGRPAKEYALTIDMAKELAMVERNEAGKRVRQYFIACERVPASKSAFLKFETSSRDEVLSFHHHRMVGKLNAHPMLEISVPLIYSQLLCADETAQNWVQGNTRVSGRPDLCLKRLARIPSRLRCCIVGFML